jgi:hypothetical protein
MSFAQPVCCLQVAASVLQLVFSHAGSPKDQLVLAAKLLPLSSTMPQLLAGRMQLAVAANTWPRVQQVASWLHRYGCMVNSLESDAVVDCCEHDTGSANLAVVDAITSNAAKFKVGIWHLAAGVQPLTMLTAQATL